MYYQNGNYMQDLNYYNQNPNYNPMMNVYANNTMPMNPMPQQNLSTFYPAVYRIIEPISSQVVSNNNTNYLTEDLLNQMVDSVYNIVEGDINVSSNHFNLTNDDSEENKNIANSSRVQTISNSSRTTSVSNLAKSQNDLLKDIIKIMILNDIISRRNRNLMNQQNNFNNNMQMPNQPMYL